MTNLVVFSLIFSISAGQLLKIPFGIQSGPTLLDLNIIILCLVGLYKSKFRLKKPSMFIKLGLAFFLITLLSLILTPLNLTANEYLISTSYSFRFLAYILFGWLVYSNIFPEIKQNLAAIFIHSGFILAVLGILQLIFYPGIEFLAIYGWDPHHFRTVSTFIDPNFLGGYLSIILLLLTVFKLTPNTVHYLYFLTIYIALLTTFSRGAALVFICSFSILTLLKRSFKLAALTIILAVGFGLSFIVYRQEVAKPRNIDREQSAQFRLNAWQQGITIFQNNPILGVGFNSYRYAIRQYHLGDTQFVNSRGASSNDSSLLYVAATTGIIGLSVYILMFISAFISGFKNNKWGFTMIAAFCGLIVQSFFSNNLFYPFFLIFIVLLAIRNEDNY